MSYDVDVYSTQRPIAPASEEGRDWQIAVHGPMNVEPEDIPAQVRTLLPGLQFLTQFHLEGNAGGSAKKKLLAMARAVATRARGIVVDQQEGTAETPRGVQRLQVEPQQAAGPLLQLSWFVEDVAPLARTLPAEMLDLFQRTIPEIMPRRYGLWEPPQFKLETHGIDHLREFLKTNLRDTVVWYCHKPCRYIYKSIPDRVGATPRGFRCGRLTLDVDGQAAADPAWRVELTRLWLSVSDFVQPFYAEIRTGACPTVSWWWNGIPAETPSALLIGKPYAELWPDFVSTARSLSTGLYYVDRFGENSGNRISAPPTNIAQPFEPKLDPSRTEDLMAMVSRRIKYPDIWPFEGPVS